MFGALAYNQNKVDSEEAKVLFSNRMLLSEDGRFSIGECMRSFEMQMSSDAALVAPEDQVLVLGALALAEICDVPPCSVKIGRAHV